MAVNRNIEVYSGFEKELLIEVRQPRKPGEAVGAPVNLPDFTGHAVLQLYNSDPSGAITAAVTMGYGESHVARVVWSADATRPAPAVSHRWSFSIQGATGDPELIAFGRANVVEAPAP